MPKSRKRKLAKPKRVKREARQTYHEKMKYAMALHSYIGRP